jgi:hypothetical protein
MKPKVIVGVLIAFCWVISAQGCGDDSGKALKAVKADKLGGKLQEHKLTKVEGKDGAWTFTGKLDNGAECKGTVSKPTDANAKWPVTVECPKVKKKVVDPTDGAFAACTGGDNASCEKIFELGKANDDDKGDFEDSLRYFELACSKDIDTACGMACVYFRGERAGVGIKEDTDKAIATCTKACDANVEGACTLLGRTLQDKKKDKAGALKVFEKACDSQKDGDACHRYGQIIRYATATRAADPVSAMDYYDRGCRHGWSGACKFLGDDLKARAGKGDKNRAQRAYSRACELGDKDACSLTD